MKTGRATRRPGSPALVSTGHETRGQRGGRSHLVDPDATAGISLTDSHRPLVLNANLIQDKESCPPHKINRDGSRLWVLAPFPWLGGHSMSRIVRGLLVV